MARPKKHKHLCYNPDVYYFKPRGVPLLELKEVCINHEEYVALRLKDYDKKDQKEASKMLDVSQPTFHRIYSGAREKISKAIVEGMAIRIEGNPLQIPPNSRQGNPKHNIGCSENILSQYMCLKCGYEVSSADEMDLMQIKCPKCDETMICKKRNVR